MIMNTLFPSTESSEKLMAKFWSLLKLPGTKSNLKRTHLDLSTQFTLRRVPEKNVLPTNIKVSQFIPSII